MYRIGQEEIDAAARVIENGGLFRINKDLREVLSFEEELSAKFGVKHSLYMTSGSGSLISILGALGIGPGDEVIVPAYTFIATPNSVLNVGAMPVVAEVDATLTIDPEDIKRKITSRTKAIIPVHLCGFPCDMDAIMAIAKEHNLYVVEDACQAVGGSYKGKRLGTIGDAGGLSFNYFKVISAGEGGGVLTNNLDIYEKALIFHDAGSSYWRHEKEVAYPYFIGSQFRACEILAAIMRVQLTRMDGILDDLKRVKASLVEKLGGKLELIPSNDSEGGVASMLAFRFESEDKARKFAGAVDGGIPYDSDRHVFIYWRPILAKRVFNNEHWNPYNHPLNQDRRFDITMDCAPKSLEHLARSVTIAIDPQWTDEDIQGVADKLLAGL